MYYLFDENGNTSTFCLDEQRLFDMFAIENDAGEKTLPDGYSIKEYDGYISPDVLYLDDAGEVKERVFKVDKAGEAAQLYAGLQSDLDEINRAIYDAVADDDNELATDLRHEKTDRLEQYQADLAGLEE